VPTGPHDRNRKGTEAEQGPSLDVHGWPQSQVQGASHAITGFVSLFLAIFVSFSVSFQDLRLAANYLEMHF